MNSWRDINPDLKFVEIVGIVWAVEKKVLNQAEENEREIVEVNCEEFK